MGDLRGLRQVLEAAVEVRRLDHERRGLGRHGLPRRRQVARPVAEGDRPEPEGRALHIGLDDGSVEGVDAGGEDNLVALGHRVGHQHGLGERGGAVVDRRVRDVHAGQLGDDRLVLVDAPQRALARLGLVRRVGGEELAARDQVTDRAGDRVVVGAGAEEADVGVGVGVGGREPAQVADQLRLGRRRRKVERPREPRAGGDPGQQVLDGVDADRGQHLPLLGGGVRDVAHG